jgi:hypothetical protein
MGLPKVHSQLFFAVIPAFVDALPLSPRRQSDAAQLGQLQSWNEHELGRRNTITMLRFEIQRSARVLTRDRAICELSDDEAKEVKEMLEYLLSTLDGLVDHGILGGESGRREKHTSIGVTPL